MLDGHECLATAAPNHQFKVRGPGRSVWRAGFPVLNPKEREPCLTLPPGDKAPLRAVCATLSQGHSTLCRGSVRREREPCLRGDLPRAFASESDHQVAGAALAFTQGRSSAAFVSRVSIGIPSSPAKRQPRQAEHHAADHSSKTAGCGVGHSVPGPPQSPARSFVVVSGILQDIVVQLDTTPRL